MPIKRSSCRLEILGEIAQGGQARVFLARALNGRLVAIKYFFDLQIFKQEVFFLGQVDHNLITRLLGILDSGTSSGLVCEYVSGANLATLQDIMLKSSRFLSIDFIIYFTQQVLRILTYLESISIVHGDLAAENILACQNGHLKLCDFGAAHGKASSMAFGRVPFGRRDFLAPEVLAGEDSSHWSDLYALGAVLFEILMHRRFSLASRQADLAGLRARLHAGPVALYYFMSSCLEPSPWQRPPSAAEARLRLLQLSLADQLRAQRELGLWVSEAPRQLTPLAHKYYVDFVPRGSF